MSTQMRYACNFNVVQYISTWLCKTKMACNCPHPSIHPNPHPHPHKHHKYTYNIATGTGNRDFTKFIYTNLLLLIRSNRTRNWSHTSHYHIITWIIYVEPKFIKLIIIFQFMSCGIYVPSVQNKLLLQNTHPSMSPPYTAYVPIYFTLAW